MESFKKIEDYPVASKHFFNEEELSVYREYMDQKLREIAEIDRKTMEWLYTHPVILD